VKEGGDCNNQAVKAASYLEAAGYDAALLYAMRSDAEAKAAEAKGNAFAYSTHVPWEWINPISVLMHLPTQ
jgi:hypothetical protein